jgi:hypothetical protein
MHRETSSYSNEKSRRFPIPRFENYMAELEDVKQEILENLDVNF